MLISKSPGPRLVVSFAITVLALFPIVVVGVRWARRALLIPAMLGNGTYSIDTNTDTVEDVRAAIPHLIAMHRKAVVACKGSSLGDMTQVSAWNSRIKTWHAILMALRCTDDAACRDYVNAFVNSNSASEDEVASMSATIQ